LEQLVNNEKFKINILINKSEYTDSDTEYGSIFGDSDSDTIYGIDEYVIYICKKGNKYMLKYLKHGVNINKKNTI